MSQVRDNAQLTKLHVIQAVYNRLAPELQDKYHESFEAACNQLFTGHWNELGYSIERANEISSYLRGVKAGAGTPVRMNEQALLKRITYGAMSLEARAAAIPKGIYHDTLLQELETEAADFLKSHGLEAFSVESQNTDTLKLIGGVLLELFNPVSWAKVARGRNLDDPLFGKTKQEQKEHDSKHGAFDVSAIKWSDLGKVTSYLDTQWSDAKIDSMQAVEGEVSATFTKRLTWGHEFDAKDPLGFQKKMLAQYDNFFAKWCAAIGKASKEVEAVDDATRANVKKVKDDIDKIEEILSAAIVKLEATNKTLTNSLKGLKAPFPNGRLSLLDDKHEHTWFHCVPDPKFKDVDKVPALSKEQAKAIVRFLKAELSNLKDGGKIYSLATWGDHSDGDEFWDIIEPASSEHQYGMDIYHQGWNQQYVDGIDDAGDVLAQLLMGLIAWMSVSLK